MPNNYFQFKQFTVHQDNCAMKVCTDACLFGAWIADTITNYRLMCDSTLDIGTGTGLLSLLLAQKINTRIDAIEIDNDAYVQARENINNSPWKNMITVHHASLQEFEKPDKKKYDIIVSNPPFFENDLISADHKKNNAKHDTSLTFTELLINADELLSSTGNFFVMVPAHRIADFVEEAAAHNLYLCGELLARQTPGHDFFRGCLQFCRSTTEINTTTISIKDKDGAYTPEFVILLKEYYLYF